MKREVIANAIDKISEEYIAEADNYRVVDKDGRILRRAAALCAALVLVVAAVPMIVKSGVFQRIIAGLQPHRDTVVALNVTEVNSYDPYLKKFAGKEYEPWASGIYGYDDPDAPRECTVEFMGETYRGEYRTTQINRFCPYVSHVYNMDGGGFSVRSDTGELDMIMFVFPIGGTGDSSGMLDSLDDEDYKRRAEEIAGEFIDTQKYNMTIKKDGSMFVNYVFGCVSGFFTDVTYTASIGGVETDDRLVLTIMGDEGLCAFYRYSDGLIDSIDESKVGRLADSDEATAAAESKLADIYGGDLDSFELSDKLIVMLDDGEPGVVYTYSVKLTARSEGRAEVYEETAELLLLLGDAPTGENEPEETTGDTEPEDTKDTSGDDYIFATDADNSVSRADAEKIEEGMSLSEVIEMIGKPNEANTEAYYPVVTYRISDYDEHHLRVICMLNECGLNPAPPMVVEARIVADYSVTDTDPDNLTDADDTYEIGVWSMEGDHYVDFSQIVDMIGKPNRVLRVEDVEEPPFHGDYFAEYDLSDGRIFRVRYESSIIMHVYLGGMTKYTMCDAEILPE